MATTTMPAVRKRKRQMRYVLPRVITRVCIYAVLLLFAFVFLYPFYNMLLGSFMDDNELFSSTPTFWPRSFDFEAYAQLLNLQTYNYIRALGNTFVIALVQMIGTLFFSALAGYAFS